MIVKYNNFINEAVNHDYLEQSVSDCLVELRDIGLDVRVKKVRNNFIGIGLCITVTSKLSENFRMIDLKESFDMMIDLLNDGYTYNVITKFRLVFRNRPKYNDDYNGYYLANVTNVVLNMDIDLFELEVTGIKGNSNIRSYESYEEQEYEEIDSFKELLNEEVDGILVDLADDKFTWFTNISEVDNNYIMEIWLDVLASFDTDEQANDFYEDDGQIFKIEEVFEPLSLLVEWMKEKYNAELIDDGMHSDTFDLKYVDTAYQGEVFDDVSNSSRWLKNEYLNRRVTALFIKFKWEK